MLAPYRGLFDPLAGDMSDFFNPETMLAPFAFPQSLTSTRGGGDQFGQLMGQVQAKAPSMSVDVIEKDDAYIVHAEIPGVNKEDVDIRFDQGVLTITAEKKAMKEWRRGEGDDQGQQQGQQGQQAAGASDVSGKADDKPQGQLHKSEGGGQLTQAQGQQGWRWYHSERSYGRTKRTIRLPKDASADQINARYENGVLEVEVKKLPEEHRAAKKISIA